MVPAPITRRSQLHGLGASGRDLASAISSVVGKTAEGAIHGVTYRSQISPDIELTARQALGLDKTEGGFGQIFMALSKPAVYVDTDLGVIRIAPWGEPKLNLFPIMLIASGFVAKRRASVPWMISAFHNLARCWSNSCMPCSPLAIALGRAFGSPFSSTFLTTGVALRISTTGMRSLPL